MFKRPHHQKIAKAIDAMNADFLKETKCYFGGGTAISLLLGEYRESVDIDFMCADQEGYRKLRESVFDHGLGKLFTGKYETLRDVRTDRDGIRTFLVVDEVPIKFEIVRESRILLEGIAMPDIPVLCLTKSDLFAEKLLANADRYGDKAVMSRDVIDLLVMKNNWGEIPAEAWNKAEGAYGNSVHDAMNKAKELLSSNPRYLNECLSEMDIDKAVGVEIKKRLGISVFKPSISR